MHEELHRYIQQALEKGLTSEEIQQKLVSHGWQPGLVEEALRQEVSNALPSIPPPPPASAVTTPSSVQPVQHSTPVKVQRSVVASPYSQLLSVVLFLSLIVFVDHALHDISDWVAPYAPFSVSSTAMYKQAQDSDTLNSLNLQQLTADYNQNHDHDRGIELIVRTMITLVFWVVAFGLHYSFGERKKQLSVLSLPYYVVAGIFLIYLLIDVFTTLFDKNAIVGIYGALATIVVALTLVIIWVQKYWHSSKTV